VKSFLGYLRSRSPHWPSGRDKNSPPLLVASAARSFCQSPTENRADTEETVLWLRSVPTPRWEVQLIAAEIALARGHSHVHSDRMRQAYEASSGVPRERGRGENNDRPFEAYVWNLPCVNVIETLGGAGGATRIGLAKEYAFLQ